MKTLQELLALNEAKKKKIFIDNDPDDEGNQFLLNTLLSKSQQDELPAEVDYNDDDGVENTFINMMADDTKRVRDLLKGWGFTEQDTF